GCKGCHAFSDGEHGPRLGNGEDENDPTVPAGQGSQTRTSKDIAPNLANVAEKTNGRWIYHWLKNPRHFSPVSRMPSLRLSDDEPAGSTSYLLTLGRKKPAPAERLAALSKPETIADGEKLVRKYGCAGCHDIPGMENESRIGVELSAFGAKTVEELFFGDHY